MFDDLLTKLKGSRKTVGDLVSEFFSPENIQLKSRLNYPQRTTSFELIFFDMAGQTPEGRLNQIALLNQQREYVGLSKGDKNKLGPDYEVTAADYGWFWMVEDRINGISELGLSRVEHLKAITGAAVGAEEEGRKKIAQSVLGQY